MSMLQRKRQTTRDRSIFSKFYLNICVCMYTQYVYVYLRV